MGVIIKNIVESLRPAALRSKITPEPNTPANPVPELKNPTTSLEKPLQNPRVVLSPRALETPRSTEEKRARKKEILWVSKAEAKEMIKKAISMLIEFINILVTCFILIKYLALVSLVKLLKPIRHLRLELGVRGPYN